LSQSLTKDQSRYVSQEDSFNQLNWRKCCFITRPWWCVELITSSRPTGQPQKVLYLITRGRCSVDDMYVFTSLRQVSNTLLHNDL